MTVGSPEERFTCDNLQHRFRHHLDLGDLLDAEAIARKLLASEPESPKYLMSMAEVHHKRGEPYKALRHLEEARLHASDRETVHEIYFRISAILVEMKKFGQARRFLRYILTHAPENADALVRLLRMPVPLYDFAQEFADDYDRLAAVAPDRLTPDMHRDAGRVKKELGDDGGSYDACISGYRRFPEQVDLLLLAMLYHLRFIYESESEVRVARDTFAAHLGELERLCEADSGHLKQVATGAAMYTTFRLAYLGSNEVGLQRRYGHLVHRALSAQCPYAQVPKATSRPTPIRGRKARIGVAGAYIHDHASWRNRRGFFYHLDKSRYELFLYDLTNKPAKDFDDIKAFSYGAFDHVRVGPHPLAKWIQIIKQDQLDLLIYPELGMHQTAFSLAALRLVPRQARMAGHPFTCGLPTIDDILTSDLMEPADAQDHYTENVVRLAGTGFYRHPPAKEVEPLTRADFGLDANTTYIFYGHNTVKFLPRDDDLLVAVAKMVPEAKLVILRDRREDYHAALHQRLRRAFAAEGLDLDDHVTFPDRQPMGRFLALIRACDILLDCPTWNGDNVTVDALSQGVPIVTMPGPFMRSRHSAGFLRRMGLEDYICADKSEMTRMVARLAHDTTFRAQYAEAIAARRDLIFREAEALESFHAYLESLFAVER